MTRLRPFPALMTAGLLAAALAVPAAAAAPVAPAASERAPVRTDDVKPGSAGAVRIDPAALATGRLKVTTDPVDGLAGATVHLAATGDAHLPGGAASRAVPAESASTSAAVAVTETAVADPAETALADAAGTTVTATLTGTTPDGEARTASDTVWVDALVGATLVSERGEQDLRLQRVDALVATGRLGADEATAVVDEIRGAAETTTTLTEGECAGNSLCVSGIVQWTDRNGGRHPVDRAPVQVRDQDPGPDTVVTTVTTDADGAFAATIGAVDSEGGLSGRDVYLRVLADGPGFTLDQHVDSTVTTDLAPGSTLVQDVTAGNVTDNATAFSVHAALTVATDEVVLQNGGPLDTVDVVFPSDGSYYDGRLNLLQLDRWDWDVILHELGHHIADQLDIERNPGGSHGDENLSNRYGKDRGTRLAWGEGWPTYFAVSTLHERAASLGVPDVGDTRYQDTEDTDIDDDLEATAKKGEDNENTVMSVLWDLYDDVADTRDQLALGTASVWDTLDAGDPERFSDTYLLFSPGGRVEAVNCIASQMNVSPKISGAATTVTATRPTFRWRSGNGGDFPNDRFTVKIRSGGGTLLLSSPTVRTNAFTPTRAQWNTVLAGADGTVRVAVVGRQADAPATGPYRSCTRAYTID